MSREELFKRWLGEHKGVMFKVVRALAASPEDQDDLFQEILLHLWSSIPSFDGRAKETTWIYKVALNTALVWKRAKKRRRRRHDILIAASNEVADTHGDAYDSTRDEQIVERLYAAIRELPKIDGSIVLMYLDGLNYHEISDILGISKSHVGVKLNRAKKQLARSLKELIDDF